MTTMTDHEARLRKAIRAALEKMPRPQFLALTLGCVSGLNFAEMAQVLDVSPREAATLWRSAMRAVRAVVAAADGGRK
jgi:DNA-directed RNA polymerase specialized sigma24 family protein